MKILSYLEVCCSVIGCPSKPLAVPPLTLEWVLRAVKGVKDWWKWGEQIDPVTNRYCFQQQHGSDENCLKAVVENFVLGRSLYRRPSWRAVIWTLYKANEIHLADKIRRYAEPLRGMCICENLCP